MKEVTKKGMAEEPKATRQAALTPSAPVTLPQEGGASAVQPTTPRAAALPTAPFASTPQAAALPMPAQDTAPQTYADAPPVPPRPTPASSSAGGGKGKGFARQLMLSALILASIAALGMLLLRKPKEAPNAPPVTDSNLVAVSSEGANALKLETAPVVLKTLAGDIEASGLVSYPADQTVKVSPRSTGRVKQVFVSVGQRVRAGQPLATLDSIDAAAALTMFRQNENKLRLARTTLERQERLFRLGTSDVTSAQAALDQARAQTLAKKDVLARLKEQAQIGGFTQKPVEDARTAVVAAQSTLAQAQSDLAQAQRDSTRKAKLVAIGISAKSELESSQNVLEKSQVAVQADKETLELTQEQLAREQKAFKSSLYSNQALNTGESDYRQAVLQEQAAQKNVRLAREQIRRDLDQARSDYQAAQTDYLNSQLALHQLGNPRPDGTVDILAPTAGTVVERNVNPGQLVDQSQETPWQMFTVSNADQVWVDADVYEQDILSIRPGQPARIRVDALRGRVFQGTVKSISPILDPKTRASKVRAVLPNPGDVLKDGMFANVTLISPRGRAVLVVPLAAIQHDGDRDYVYVSEGAKYRRRAVKIGKSLDSEIVIQEGLKPGERIVTHGALFLGDQASGG